MFSDHSFTSLAAAMWQDSISVDRNLELFLTSHIDFCSFLDNVEIIARYMTWREFACAVMHRVRALRNKINNDSEDGHCYSFGWI